MEKTQQNIHQALIAIMREVLPIEKKERNEQQRFNFRGIDTIMNDLHDLFAKHGVVILPNGSRKETRLRQSKSGGDLMHTDLFISYKFIAEDGSFVEVPDVPSEAMDSGDKATFKAMSGALKYCLMQMFLIPTAEKKDPDADSYEVAAPKPAPKVLPELHFDTDAYRKAVRHIAEVPGWTLDRLRLHYRISDAVARKLELDASNYESETQTPE
jgi:hypothetical protein